MHIFYFKKNYIRDYLFSSEKSENDKRLKFYYKHQGWIMDFIAFLIILL